MPEEEDLVELKFRLYDGSDVGPFHYSPTATVGMLKERIVSEWPKGELRGLYYKCSLSLVNTFLTSGLIDKV